MTLASEAREAVRERPFLLDALRAGVVNYTAAARHLDVDGEEEAVATALRRFAEGLPEREPSDRGVRVTMETGLGPVGEGAGEDGRDDGPSDDGGDGEAGGVEESAGPEDPLLVVGGTRLTRGGGDLTGVLGTGDVDPGALAWALDRLMAVDVPVEAAGVAEDAMLVVVPRRSGPDALRVVEDALSSVPGQ